EPRPGGVRGLALELFQLRSPRLRQSRHSGAGVLRVGRGGDQALALERTQQPAHVPRIEPEPLPEPPQLAHTVADLVEEPGLAKRQTGSQERVVECAYSPGDGAVEAADSLDGVEHRLSDHSQVIIRDQPRTAPDSPNSHAFIPSGIARGILRSPWSRGD